MSKAPSLDRWIGVALGLLALVVLLGTAPGYGLTYDEPVYTSRAMRAGEWLGLVFTAPGAAFSREVIDRLWDPAGDEQAGLMKLIAWPAAGIASAFVGPLAAVRVATMLVVALLVGLLYVFVASVWGRLEGVFAALGLLAMPRVFTHCHLMAMDAPVMAWSGMALMAAANLDRTALAARCGEEKSNRAEMLWLALLGLAFGAAIATKVNGWFVPLIVLPCLKSMRHRWLALLSLVAGGGLVFFLSWPWLWHDTVSRVLRYLSFFGKHYPVGVTYFGETYNVAPWHFAVVMLMITTPVLVLLLAAVGMGGLRRRTAAQLSGEGERPPCSWRLDWQRAVLGLMVWAVFINLLPSSLPSSPKYNGVRLFLPVFVPLIILAAAGFGRIARALGARLGKTARETRMVLGLLLVLALAPGLYATARSYPYGMSYYNELIGGTKGAVARGMEATYWGDTFYAACPWLNAKATEGADVWINVPGFVSTMQMYQQFGALRGDLKITGGEEAFARAQYHVVANKSTELGQLGKELVRSGKVVYTQELDGVPLVWVFEGRGTRGGPEPGSP